MMQLDVLLLSLLLVNCHWQFGSYCHVTRYMQLISTAQQICAILLHGPQCHQHLTATADIRCFIARRCCSGYREL